MRSQGEVERMNSEELFKELHRTFTGKENETHLTINKYEKLSHDEGLKKAEEYLESSKRGQDQCRSDWAYWAYEGDITLAKILVNIFTALKRGIEDFPKLPKLSPFLMDKTHQLQEWAENLKNIEAY